MMGPRPGQARLDGRPWAAVRGQAADIGPHPHLVADEGRYGGGGGAAQGAGMCWGKWKANRKFGYTLRGQQTI